MMDAIAENILLFFPLYYKKLMRGAHMHPGKRASVVEAPILNMLVNAGPLPISAIGRKLHISKPNMTSVVDKLIETGKVERMPDKKDRRVTRIAITGRGRVFIRGNKRLVKESMKRNLSSLSRGDLATLCASLDHMRIILSKIGED